jgi:glycosyltransferase involved in cell wall biosynthesis
MNPQVSFIIPFYNDGDTITETIASVLNQSYTNYDIWIINDGSTDEKSLETLKSFIANPKIKILNQSNAGSSVARNNAIKQTLSTIIVPLDSDDLIEPYALEKAIPYLLNADKTGVVYGDLKLFGEKVEIKKQDEFNLSRQFIYNQVAVCTIIRKEVFEQCGYYDEYLSKLGLEDWEFWIRVGKNGWKFEKLNEVFFKIRISKNSRTFKVANKNLNHIKEYVFQKHAVLLSDEYLNLFYQKKMILETPDYRIGNIILKPWRLLKSIF